MKSMELFYQEPKEEDRGYVEEAFPEFDEKTSCGWIVC